jgi:CO dehydrogenase maturation factor
MEAGLEHLGRGTTAYMDALIVVVEPGVRSFQTARQTRKLAADLGLERVYIVGNKAATEADKALIRGQMADLPVLGIMSHSEAIAEADRRGVSPFDLDPSVRREVEEILENLAPLSR